jgi:Fe-S-cluster containining protein
MNTDEARASVRRSVSDVLRRQGFVSTVEVLMDMGKLSRKDYEDWRMGRVPFLEQVVGINLGRLQVILRELAATCRQLGLKESFTDYRKWGKGKKVRLRFSKSGDPHVEEAYATHFVSQRAGQANAGPAQPRIVETDPVRLAKLAEARADSHLKLRTYLKGRGAEAETDALFARLYEEVSREIECTKCANCCVRQSPLLHDEDVERLSRKLGLTPIEVEQTLLRKDADGFLFVRQPCPLLKGKLCSCYEDRPEDCRAYPHLDKPGRTSSLLSIIGNAEICPIIYEVLERMIVALGRRP